MKSDRTVEVTFRFATPVRREDIIEQLQTVLDRLQEVSDD